MGRSRKARLPTTPVCVQIESLNQEGRGVAHIEGKAIFIADTLPGEQVDFIYTAKHRRFDEGRVDRILTPSPARVEPRCTYFGLCGGCSLQHMESSAQIAAKQQMVLEALQQVGHVQPEAVLPALRGPAWGYRRKARLGVRDVAAKGRVLVGFRERKSSYVADIKSCEVLHPKVGTALNALSDLLGAMSLRNQIPQIEVAMGDQSASLVFRILATPTEADCQRLLEFGQHWAFDIFLQTAGPESITPLSSTTNPLEYRLDAFDLDYQFLPNDFTQVNAEINQSLVALALDLLAPSPKDRVLDLFCGLGNFSLPIAQRAAWTVGVEGDAALVNRAKQNAKRNAITTVEFQQADLCQLCTNDSPPWAQAGCNKLLLDPPRTGAKEIVERIRLLGWPWRIVYVSCNPATLARDAGELVHQQGYYFKQAGVIDMFPHTAHVESIAIFERKSTGKS